MAPLELVLSLPILLMVMALMMVFGTAGAWKVRTMANSREAAFRALRPRTGDRDDNPQGWPKNAEMNFREAGPSLMPTDPFAEHTCVRGPVLSDGGSGQYLLVNTQHLDMQFGIHHGHSRIERDFPMFTKMPPGKIDFPRETVIVDGTLWQYPSMGIGSNVTRRIIVTYDFQLQQRAASQCAEYNRAAMAIVQNPRKDDLTPLEGGDPEIRQMFGETSPDFVGRRPMNVEYRRTTIPQVSSRVPNYCQTEPGIVRVDKVEDYKRIIERLIPREMSDYYIGKYQQRINQLESMMPQPPGAAAEIEKLKKWVEQIQQYKGSLPPLFG